MRYLLFLVLFVARVADAQTFSFPKLPAATVAASGVAISNWKIIDVAQGDLNGDNLDDLAVILESNMIINEKRAYGDADTELIEEHQKPRILAIYFKNSTGKYTLALQNNDFILRAEEGGTMGDPFRKISVSNNKLLLAFEGGANWRWKLNYQFKYRDRAWTLIRANNTYYHAVSGEMTDKSYDFMSHKVIETTGNLFSNVEENKKQEVALRSTPRTLSSLKKPWTWEITTDNFL